MVYILYTNEQYTDAGQILYFLTKEKNLSVSSYCENCYVLHADNRIDQDAAIVLLSNAAVMDENWQALVRDIPEGVRLIPVSSTKQLENIWDSLITETGFYDIKSRLLLNKNIWHFSKCSDDFLLSNSKKINEYLLLFQKKSEEEKNPYFRDELLEIVHYLEVSLQYSKKAARKKFFDYTRRAGIAIAAAAFVILFIKATDFVEHSNYAKVIISVDSHGEVAPVNSIKLVDGITNPYISDTAKLELYNKLSEDLDKNWHNSPVGINYKWALNDAQIAANTQYIWSANGDGSIAKWDTYTGGIVLKEKVSDQSLVASAVSQEETLFVALDSEGYIYKKYHE